MSHLHSHVALSACLALALGVTAQDVPKVSRPLPAVDLDAKAGVPVLGPVAPPRTASEATATDALRQRPQPPPERRDADVALPDGSRFRVGLPAGEVVFAADADGTVWAEGDDYKASFTRDRFTYVPYFGSEAPQNYPLAFELEAAALGGAVPLTTGQPQRRGNTVTIDRGAVVERYDLRHDGVEQKFEIARPFQGELTLTLRVRTELQPQADAAGLRFANALGHVAYSRAVMVDARGQRLAMATDYADGRITLRASAAALAGAVFPVTVDPVVTTFGVTSNGDVLMKPDIAYEQSSGNYLVVWVRVFTATDRDVHAMAIDRNGNVVAGSSTLIDNTSDWWDDCRVAACPPNFLVVASRRPAAGGTLAIWGRTRSLVSTAMGPQFEISSTEIGDKVAPDVGGEYAGPTNFCVVWQRVYTASDNDIHCRVVTAAGVLAGGVRFIDNSSANDDRTPRIAKCDGGSPAQNQVWPVVFERRVSNQGDIYGARVLWDGTLVTPPFGIDTGAGNDLQPAPSSLTNAIGGSRYFVVAYTTGRTGNYDVFLRAYRDGATPTNVSTEYLSVLEGLSGPIRALDQFRPQIDSDGSRFAIAYMEQAGTGNRDAYVSTIDLAPLMRCVDPRIPLTTSTRDSSEVAIVANRSGGGTALDYGTSWNLYAASIFSNWVEGAVYRGVTPAGGFNRRATACGGMGISYAGGSQTPAPGALLRFDLTWSGPGFFMIGTPQNVPLCPPMSCGLGTSMAIVLALQSLPLNVPYDSSLVGGTISVQGVAASPLGCPNFQLVTSDTIDVTIR